MEDIKTDVALSTEMAPVDEIIILTQLPVIVEQLHSVKADILAKTEEAKSLACTDETVQTVKRVRTQLNKVMEDYESKRKAIKSKILEPYSAFELVYKECITDPINKCVSQLTTQIDEVQDTLKAEKDKIVEEYFNEYATSKGIDFVTFDKLGIKCNLSTTKSCKKEKEAVKAFIDRVVDELALIDTQDHSAEILVEYKSLLNVAQAINKVIYRHRAVAAETVRIEQKRQVRTENIEAFKRVESALTAAVEVEKPKALPSKLVPEEKVYTLTFSVEGTLENLKGAKLEFLQTFEKWGLKQI